MKRASKILTLILIVVFVLSVFAGCDLIGRNTAKYRSTVAMKVGNEEITVGKLLDTFNSYYNSYYYYISSGIIDAEYLLRMVMDSLIQQYVQVDDYVKNHDTVTEALAALAHNAEYLTEEQFAYCIKYVVYTSFTTFDTSVLTTLSVNREIADAEDEDSARDFTEWDDLKGAETYVEYLRNKNFEAKEADEYFEKYYNNGFDFTADFEQRINNLTKGYVYESEEVAETILEELNKRIEDEDEKIDFDEYKEAQQKAIDKYSDNIQNAYGVTLEEFLKTQVEDMVTSCILALWSYEKYKDVGGDIEETLTTTNKTLYDKQVGDFTVQKNFDSFITSLSDNSFIYNVPEDMKGQYIFVKNILIPFTSKQSAWLSDQSGSYGGTESDAYIALRNRTAERITAEYFYSDKYDADIEKIFEQTGKLVENDDEDSDSKYKKLGNLFKTVDGKITIDQEGILGEFFNSDNTVKTIGDLNASQTIVELMKRFNTDTAQHTTRYDYVVYVGKDWEDYSHSWVKEFYTAVNELGHDEATGKFNESNIGKYAMCVSTYGVHIIYVEGFVESKVYNYSEVNWAEDWKDTTSLNYVRYKEAFDKLVSNKTQDEFEALEATYIKEGLITVNSQFKRFLKDNDFTFDFNEYLEDTLKELHIDD